MLSARGALGLQQPAWTSLESLNFLVFFLNVSPIVIKEPSVYQCIHHKHALRRIGKAIDVDDGFFERLFPLVEKKLDLKHP